jgi:hypothetical protein
MIFKVETQGLGLSISLKSKRNNGQVNEVGALSHNPEGREVEENMGVWIYEVFLGIRGLLSQSVVRGRELKFFFTAF